jgi:predicted RNA-binding Zn-ribbon protein involved in translation (DUF1610 family)
MINREKTIEIFGYDIDPNTRRRTDAEFESTNKINKRNLKVVDNCPSCNVERIISLHASRKNKLCYKCHHNRPEVILAKQNQNKIKSEETKRKMSENHWSLSGMESPFKGKKQTAPVSTHRPTIYLVSGVSGAGKSWVCEQLLDKFSYVSYDRNSKSKHLDLLKQPSDKPKLYDPPIKISTFIRRHSDIFDIHPIFIIEDEATIKARLAQRGGVFTDSAIKRIAAIKSRNKKYGVFSGTSSEVLVYLQNTVV